MARTATGMKTLLAIIAVAEILTAVTLLALPWIVIRLLFDAEVAGVGLVVSRIAGIGRPRMARAWRSNSERFCEIEVTMPVSCGLGESSEKTASSPRTKNSTPKMP